MLEEESQLIQLWVRTEKGQVFGPLSPTSVELLIDNQVISGRMQVSTDGTNYVYPGRLPGVRMVFPRALWGEVIVPGDELDQQWSVVVAPPSITVASSPSRPGAVPGAPVSAAAQAGPGARSQATQRAPPLNPASRPPASSPSAAFSSSPSAAFASRPSSVPVSSPSAAYASRPSSAPTSSPSAAFASRPSSVPSSAPASAEALFADLDVPPPPRGPASSSASSVQPPPVASTPSGARPAHVPSPSRAQPPATALPSSGTLEQFSPMRLYGLCAAADANALLTLRLSDRELRLHFKKGAPEFVDSTHAEDSLQSFLMARGLASSQQLGLAEAQKERFGGELLPALFGLGLINPGTAFQQLSERATSILFRALTAEAGTFTLQPLELAPARAMPLGNKWAVYLEQLRRAPIMDVRRRMISSMNLPVMRAGGGVDVADLKLLPQEARALTFFDGVHSLSQLGRQSPGDSDALLRTAWMLQALELVSFAAAPDAIGTEAVIEELAPPPPARAAVPGPPPGVVPGGPPQLRPAVPGPPPGVAPGGPPQLRPAVPGPPPGVVPGGPPQLRPAVPGPPPAVAAPAAPAPVRGAVPGPPPGVAQKVTVPYPTTKPEAPVARPPGAPVPRPAGSPAAPAPPARPVVTATISAPATHTPAPPGTRTPAPPATRTPMPVAPTDPRQVMELLEKMKSQNYFELFGISKQADAAAVKAAYFKLAKSYHPDTVPVGTPADIAKAKADIFALIGQANRTLSDPKLKEDYLAELEAGGTGEKVDIAALLQGEEFFQKGRILVKARKFAEAVKVLNDAIGCNASEGEYYGWRGYSKFFLQQDKAKGMADAMKDIDHSLRMNPNAAAVHCFVGLLWKLMGDVNKAQAAFKRCVELDPRNIDAQRELRTTK